MQVFQFCKVNYILFIYEGVKSGIKFFVRAQSLVSRHLKFRNRECNSSKIIINRL